MQPEKLLTKDDLKDLTDSNRRKEQIKMLSDNGVRFMISAKGNIKTTWEAVNSVLVSRPEEADDEPNLDWMKRNND